MKTKKFLSMMLSLAMFASIGLTGCSTGDTSSAGGSASDNGSSVTQDGGNTDNTDNTAGGKQTITVWAPEEVSALTQTKPFTFTVPSAK